VGKVYDVGIIGGGLAGLSLAILLVRNGKSVILFEANKYPFHKVCGEYLSMESWPFLEKLGIPLSKMGLPRITELKLTSLSGSILKHRLSPGGFGLSRFTLDKMLADKAKDSGVTVLEGTKITDAHFDRKSHQIITTNANRYESKLLIGAYGKFAVIDRKMKRSFLSHKNCWVAVKYHVDGDFTNSTIELHGFKGGYCGIIKVDLGCNCMCYITTNDNLKQSGGTIAEMEQTILMRNPYLKQIFDHCNFLYDKPLSISRLYFERKSLIQDHLLMVGDASRVITPLCGNGMSMALNGSALLAPLLIAFLEDEIHKWAIHPGGRKILESAEKGLNLTNSSLTASYTVLRKFGNMSSATTLFVLKELWENHLSWSSRESIFALAFGPGLTMESAVLEAVNG